MRKYEVMFIVKSTLGSADAKKCAESIKKIVTDNKGKVLEFNELGEKKLAYPVKKEISGYYTIMKIEVNNEARSEFDRKISLNENVLRHLITLLDEE